MTTSKHNKIVNAWKPWEDRLAIGCREAGLTGRQISDTYMPWRTSVAINLRLNKLNSHCYNNVKKDVYWIEPGLKGLVFDMPEKTTRTRYNPSFGVDGRNYICHLK